MCCLLSLLVVSGERRLGKIRLGVIKPKIITMDSVFALESEVSYQSFGLC